MRKYVRTLNVIYDFEIDNWEVALFRGAVVEALGSSSNVLFHNHTEDNNLRYAYPLIQYKRQGRKACIVAVEQGADTIGQFLASGRDTLRIGNREVSCEVGQIRPSRILVQTWQTPFQYHISRWLPLNAKNYALFSNLKETEERKNFLEHILKGNLLSMLKGLNIWLEENLTVKITSLPESFLVRYKNVDLMAFNVDFETNLSIPANVGVGKHVSVGFGTIRLNKKAKTEQPEQEKATSDNHNTIT